jgi:hypothetical protein
MYESRRSSGRTFFMEVAKNYPLAPAPSRQSFGWPISFRNRAELATWVRGLLLPDNIASNALFYPTLLHSTPPHSHSIVWSNHDALIQRCKFFQAPRRTVSAIRQKFALLISNRNFDNQRFARFQRLSTSIGRFTAQPWRLLAAWTSRTFVATAWPPTWDQ